MNAGAVFSVPWSLGPRFLVPVPGPWCLVPQLMSFPGHSLPPVFDTIFSSLSAG